MHKLVLFQRYVSRYWFSAASCFCLLTLIHTVSHDLTFHFPKTTFCGPAHFEGKLGYFRSMHAQTWRKFVNLEGKQKIVKTYRKCKHFVNLCIVRRLLGSELVALNLVTVFEEVMQNYRGSKKCIGNRHTSIIGRGSIPISGVASKKLYSHL